MSGADIKDGFYRCSAWPWFIQVHTDAGGTHNVWGFSIYRNRAGYRTAGISLKEWSDRPESVGVRLHPDCDRTRDQSFIAGYKQGVRHA